MTEYEKGYYDAQWEMANRLYECYLNKYIFGKNWQMIEYITGLSLDDLEKLLFEYDEKLTAACLAESDSLRKRYIVCILNDTAMNIFRNSLA